MEDFRCQCGKIIYQFHKDVIIIKCRHCKRAIKIRTKGIVSYGIEEQKIEEAQEISLK